MPLSHQIPIFENIAAAVMYVPIFLVSGMLFYFIQTKHTISFQRDLYISLTVQSFLRITLNAFDAFAKGVASADLNDMFGEQYYYVKLLSVGFEMVGTYVSFSVYLSLAAFWAEQYYEHKINLSTDTNEAYLKKKESVKKKINSVYWMITIITYVMVVAILVVYFVFQDEFIYQLMRIIIRFLFTFCIVTFLFYYGIRLYIAHRKSYASIPDARLTRVLLLSFVCSFMFIALSIHNLASFIFYEEYHQSGYRWLFFLLAVLIECTSNWLLLVCMRPLTWCQKRPRSLIGWCFQGCLKIFKGRSSVEEISFGEDVDIQEDEDEELKHLTLKHESSVILPQEDDEKSEEEDW